MVYMKPKKIIKHKNTAIKTFYVYDDTFDAYENARNHVHKRLLDHGTLTDKYSYSITNNHPAGWDCICVDVDAEGLENVNSFMGNTLEMESNDGDKWMGNSRAILTIERMVDGGCEIYYDGDRNCGVWVVSKPKRKKKRLNRKEK